jgi:hypothetical protein
MLNSRHTRRSETPAQARVTLRVIQIIIENSRSYSSATTEEINKIAWEQSCHLTQFRGVAANDPIRCAYVDRVGCGYTIEFRRNSNDYNTISYRCGITTQDTPHVCCICEAILSIHRRRQSRQLDTTTQILGFDEEESLVNYRNTGIIRTRYLGQYVELERQRQLQIQENQFTAFRNSALQRSTGSSARLERNVRRDDSEESEHSDGSDSDSN